MNIGSRKNFFRSWIDAVLVLIILCGASQAMAQGSILGRISFGSSVTRYAAGDVLPVTVVLSNFGAGERVDVAVRYEMTNAGGKNVFSKTETVAVETTDSFVRQIQIPNDLPSGEYTLTSMVVYPGQTAPAASSFKFKIERKIGG